jgi:glycosyltransferase involved in cell wall biosynthesis
VNIRFIVLNAYAKGGTARTTLDTASRLAGRHDVEVVSVNRFKDALSFDVDPRVRVRHLIDKREVGGRYLVPTIGHASRLTRTLALTPNVTEPLRGKHDARLSLLSDIRLAREIRSMREGLLVGTRPSINLAVARLARRSVYALGQEHQYLQLWQPSMQQAVARSFGRFDAVTGLTKADADSYRAILPDGVLVTDLPNAVPTVGFERSDLTSRVVMAVGRLAHQKGFDILIDAFRIVADRHPDWSLHIYGTGRSRRALAEQIRRLGLTGSVVLKGFSSELPRDLAGGSIFAMSSRFEGFSLALVEAMAVGLPPVAFACPQGPIEIIQDGVDGVLVPPEDTLALATGICSLIENPQRRAELGAAAHRSVDRYSTEAVDERWEQLIEELTARPPGLRRRLPIHGGASRVG